MIRISHTRPKMLIFFTHMVSEYGVKDALFNNTIRNQRRIISTSNGMNIKGNDF